MNDARNHVNSDEENSHEIEIHCRRLGGKPFKQMLLSPPPSWAYAPPFSLPLIGPRAHYRIDPAVIELRRCRTCPEDLHQ
jgi:hypothetical protein